jgi:hypothetical protein
MIKKLIKAHQVGNVQVAGPEYSLALGRPKKLREAEVHNLITNCWKEDPVHHTADTYHSLAGGFGLLALLLQTRRQRLFQAVVQPARAAKGSRAILLTGSRPIHKCQ